MTMRSLLTHTRCATFTLSLLLGASCVTPVRAPSGDGRSDFYFLTNPRQRLLSPDAYFAHEYARISRRRGTDGGTNARPSGLLGVSMSGGGIRSAAFQLGLLSGLHAAHALRRVDYVSSVSGGSWASGAYWHAPVSDAELFACLDEYASAGTTSPGCEFAAGMLRIRQDVSLLPFQWFRLTQRKVQWERDIAAAYLEGGCRVDFNAPETVAACAVHAPERPYPIFNSTHSAVAETSHLDNLPFETTPDYQGTLIERPGSETGFFVRNASQDFDWELRKWQRYNPWADPTRKTQPGSTLSLILAHSSGVVGSGKPYLLQYSFDVHYRHSPIEGLRRTYQLTDGGKAENLGLLPLLERRVDVIVVSDIGKEDAASFHDWPFAAQRAEKLLRCTFPASSDRHVAPVSVHAYSCASDRGEPYVGTLIRVRPTIENTALFLRQLAADHPALYQELDGLTGFAADDRFPETPTFRSEYPLALIRAYYLLGHELAADAVASAIVERLPPGP